MKIRPFLSRRFFLCAIVLITNAVAMSRASVLQTKPDQPKISAAEAAAVKALEAAVDIDAKFVAAADFVKKYPKSNARQHLAEYLADQIFGAKDPSEQLAQAQKFATIFTQPGELNSVKPVLIDAYVKLKGFDEAFSTGASYLAGNSDDLFVLTELALAGTEQAKQQNPKFVAVSKQYGAKAIELIEADKKPANMQDAFWVTQKAMLPQLYQEMAVISLMEQKVPEAQAKLAKAVQLNPTDPINYVLLSTIKNEEYQKAALTYRDLPPGKAKDDQLQKATALIDQVIDLYAHAAGLSEGKPKYQTMHGQVLEDLQTYYKYRHQNSTEGLQKLIDGYKLP
jgi:hypothetical protein